MGWIGHLSKAIEYIEGNLDQAISYEEAARVACCSTAYFQRLFSYVAEVPLSEYIRRRRMTQAAFEIQSSEAKIMDIALKYGYGSPTAFNRAFRNVHGVSPVFAREKGMVLNAYPPIRLSVQMMGGDPMPYRIEAKEGFRVVGFCIPVTADMECNRRVVPAFWEEVWEGKKLSSLRRLSGQARQDIFGITDCRAGEGGSYYIAVPTGEPAPEGMFELQVPAATWAVFESRGPFKESVQRVFGRFGAEWLPFSGYAYAELPDIEAYPMGRDEREGRSEVWIGIKKKEVGDGGHPCRKFD